MTEIGLISDTHGLLREGVAGALEGVERILHAGDVCGASILPELEKIAPITAVRGNCDHGAWAEELPWTAEIEAGGLWIHMRHILDDLDLDPAAAGFAAVISGHTHRPVIQRRNGVLYVNPGSAGPRRFSLPVTVARLTVEHGRAEARIVELDAGREPRIG